MFITESETRRQNGGIDEQERHHHRGRQVREGTGRRNQPKL